MAVTGPGRPAVALAHDGHVHKALGTIASTRPQVEIKTTDADADGDAGQETAVTRGKDKLDARLKVGERVSVDYAEANKVMLARAVKLGTTAAAKK